MTLNQKNTLKQQNLVRPSPFHALNNNPISLIFNSPETHNWGTESDPGFKYHNGNSEPRGFGNIGVTVDDTYKACERFERLGVEFVKKPNDGKMKGIAFIKDPDGYWTEIFDLKTTGKVTETAA